MAVSQYKVDKIFSKSTIIREFWDGIFVKTWRVNNAYNGGDILSFIRENEHICSPNFMGLNEYYDKLIECYDN